MPVDIKLDYTNWEHERVVLAADPTLTTTVFDAGACQSVMAIMVFQDAATADAVVETLTHGDLDDGADQTPVTRTAFVYPLNNPAASKLVRVLEFKPSKRYFQLSLAGVATSEFVEVVVVKQNCRKPGVGSEKPLVPDGLQLSSLACTIDDGCE
jgi:hypothetical protein